MPRGYEKTIGWIERLSLKSATKLTGLPVNECRLLLAAIDKRKWWVTQVGPAVAALATFWGWMIFFGRTTDALEGTDWDILPFGGGMLGFGVAIPIATLVWVKVRSFVARREFRRHLFLPACFWCGYQLGGLAVDTGVIRCPECGKLSRACPEQTTNERGA